MRILSTNLNITGEDLCEIMRNQVYPIPVIASFGGNDENGEPYHDIKQVGEIRKLRITGTYLQGDVFLAEAFSERYQYVSAEVYHEPKRIRRVALLNKPVFDDGTPALMYYNLDRADEPIILKSNE